MNFAVSCLAIFFYECAFFNTAQFKCEGLTSPTFLSKREGSITSPRYPKPHPRNQNCKWFLTSFQNDDILLIVLRKISLDSNFIATNSLTLPDDEKLDDVKMNSICKIYDTNKTIQACSKGVRSSLSHCAYRQLKQDDLPPTIFFKSSSMRFFADSKGFSITYKIRNCKREMDQSSMTAQADVTHIVNDKSNILQPSVVAIVIFVIAFVTVAACFTFYRKQHVANRNSIKSVGNVYEASTGHQKDTAPSTLPCQNVERTATYDSIREPTQFNRKDMASYLSHSLLVQYPNKGQSKDDQPSSPHEYDSIPGPFPDIYVDDVQYVTMKRPGSNE